MWIIQKDPQILMFGGIWTLLLKTNKKTFYNNNWWVVFPNLQLWYLILPNVGHGVSWIVPPILLMGPSEQYITGL